MSYNSALAACARAGVWQEALLLLRRMSTDGVAPDTISYNTVMDALAREAQSQPAMALLSTMYARGPKPEPITVCSAVSACEAAGDWKAALRALAPPRDEGESRKEHGLKEHGRKEERRRNGEGRKGRGTPRLAAARRETAALAPAYASAVRACAKAGQLRVALRAVKAAEAALAPGTLHPSAYATLERAGHAALASASASTDGAVKEEAELQAAAVAQLVAARLHSAVDSGGGGSGQGGSSSSRGVQGGSGGGGQGGGVMARAYWPAQASFVLEGAQVQCAHGENASSPMDVFLTRGPSGEISGTVDIAREARALVYRMRRRGLYSPLLSSLPASSRGGGLSTGRRRRLLSQQAEKKALAAQLALGYDEPRVHLTHKMGADSHAFFKAVSLAEGKRIVAHDARVKHVFEGGQCSCGDATYTDE